MPNKGYNYKFKMYMEGVEAPFYSAVIICTPNGVEANINIPATKEAMDLAPKTAVQLFYRDFHNGMRNWRLCFDGFFSAYSRADQAAAGRAVGIVCKDFRMDIRKAPAALAYIPEGNLTAQNFYHQSGLFHTFVVHGQTPPNGSGQNAQKGDAIRTYSSDLVRLQDILMYIAGTANNKALKEKKIRSTNKPKTDAAGAPLVPVLPAPTTTAGAPAAVDVKKTQDQTTAQKGPASNQARQENAFSSYDDIQGTMSGVDGAFFLDAVVRGLWTEAVGGTVMGTFMNKRIRADKRIVIARNHVGYNMFRRNAFGIQTGSYMMGSSMFTSLEAAIMRVAAMFLTRVYSCSTPSLIDVSDYYNGPGQYIMDESVWKFLIRDNAKEFGQPYLLNETMLLPPFEFTAPPTCNLIFPPMYNNINFQKDHDIDITRGYFKQVDCFSTPGSETDIGTLTIQVPNALANLVTLEGSSKDQWGRRKPPLTLEERYKGVNMINGSVEYNLAGDDATNRFVNSVFAANVKEKVKRQIEKLENDISKLKKQKKPENAELQKQYEENLKQIKKNTDTKSKEFQKSTEYAMKRHAIIKFMNQKYSGRAVSIESAFNPYIMCGFPGAVIADDSAYGNRAAQTMIGMVQQVKHFIAIANNSGEASTSVVMNCVRAIDEPTDVDDIGMPKYMQKTDPVWSEIDINTFKHMNPKSYTDDVFCVPPSKATLKDSGLDNRYYDLDPETEVSEYKYAKDFVSLNAEQLSRGAKNTSYLDVLYDPQHISQFYKNVFGQRRDQHYMIGHTTVNGKEVYYTYDTIHEALDELKNAPELMHDYEACMRYVHREVCTGEEYFHAILGLSSKQEQAYVNRKAPFTQPHVIDGEYYGVSTEVWDWDGDDIKGLKSSQLSDFVDVGAHGLMTAPGQFSSITEHMPLTPFITERRKKVEAYLGSKMIKGWAEGIKFRG